MFVLAEALGIDVITAMAGLVEGPGVRSVTPGLGEIR